MSERNPFKAMAWALENEARELIPNFKTLDPNEIAKGSEPGIYVLVGPGNTRAYLTVQQDGTAKLWNLDYDPEYLQRAFKEENLIYKGKKTLPSASSSTSTKPSTPLNTSNSERGKVPKGQTCPHGNKNFCGFCLCGKDPDK